MYCSPTVRVIAIVHMSYMFIAIVSFPQYGNIYTCWHPGLIDVPHHIPWKALLRENPKTLHTCCTIFVPYRINNSMQSRQYMYCGQAPVLAFLTDGLSERLEANANTCA